jgi:predicted phosphodiesterase
MLSHFGKFFGISKETNVSSFGKNSWNLGWKRLPSLFQRRQYSFIRMCDTKRGSFQTQDPYVADGFLEFAKPAHNTILQFTDLHHYNNGSKEDAEGIKLIGTLAERVKPDLVVLTGDIIDARYCGNYKCFRNVVSPLIDLKIPWTYVPGNHDDETRSFTRKDLLNVYNMPLCASKNARSFNHTIHLGPLQIYLIDSHGYVDNSAELLSYDHIKEDQIDWFSKAPITGECGIAFFHIPLIEYKKSRILVGQKGEEPCTPMYNSGFFKAVREKKDMHALFVGHDHWNDFTSVLNGVWLCYGRVSGFTYSTVYGDKQSPANKERGGRVIRYDSGRKLLSTWVENKKGMEKESLISKQIQSGKETQLD